VVAGEPDGPVGDAPADPLDTAEVKLMAASAAKPTTRPRWRRDLMDNVILLTPSRVDIPTKLDTVRNPGTTLRNVGGAHVSQTWDRRQQAEGP
jgi:hypothetical protein